jgi:2-methylisocitrate lyase-like PEP mutase family enzyme
MPARPQDAATFHALHRDFLILPNAWDAASARIVQDAGAKAIATSSAAVAWAHGAPDGNKFAVAKLVTVIEEIARVVSVPVTCDAEAGYSDDLGKVGETITALIGAGAVGINLEDGKATHEMHLRKIEAARNAGEKLVPEEQAVAETLRRAAAIKNAGASGLFAPGAVKPDEIAAIAEGAGLPLNLMGWPGLPNATELKALGVKRLSAATSIFNAAMESARAAAAAFLADGDSNALWARRGSPPDYNNLFGNG